MQIETHPLNTSFAWRDHSGPYRILTEEQARAFDRDGFFVMGGVFSRDLLARVEREIDPIEEKATAWLRKQGGSFQHSDADAITFTIHMAARSPMLREFVSSEFFQNVSADLVGPDVRLYWDQAVYKKPEKPRPFPWHQDNGYTYVEPQEYLTCWIPLVDATEKNGCPVCVPGVHRRGTLRHWSTPIGFQCLEDPENAVVTPARAGDVVVFSSLTPHQTGPNTTDAVRKAYIVQFAPDGACALRGESDKGELTRETQDDSARQFLILKDGKPAAAS